MASAGGWQSLGPIVCVVMLTTPSVCRGQAAALTPADPGPETALAATSTPRDERWEVTLDGRVGFPIGRLKVGEFPTGSNKLAGGGSPGTALRLHDLGIEVSEALEGSVAFHVTPGDAVRVSYLYYFLDGRTTLHHSVFYNGPEFTPGSLSTNADYYRLSLDYERTLLSRPSGDRLIGGVGLTYVNLNPTLTGNSPSASAEGSRGSNSEDFYRQELPVPILGVRWDHPLGPRLLLRTSVAGGGLPRIDSLRKEGGTIYLRQSHADADARLAYVLGRHAEVEVGYHFTYFFQEEKSHEDKNVFELIDNGFQLGLRVRF
jgi:hypothetical protein